MSLVLNVEILGEYKNLTKATQGAQKTLEKLGTSFKKVGAAVGKTVAGIGIGLGAAVASQIKPAIDAASDLEQQYGALDSVFKDIAPSMKQFASEQYRIGLSTADAARSMTLLGSQLKGYGLPVDEAASKTQELTLLAADLAATFGGTTADAVTSISALFRGEYDPIEKYGVAIKKSDVNARLAAEGLDKLEGEQLKMAEAQTALTLLFEKTTDAQGQANREMDTAAARSERLKATFENLQAEMGNQLLPIFVDVVTYITETIIPAFQDFYAELTDPSGEAMQQMQNLGDQWMNFVGTFQFGSTQVKNQDVFKWIGDSAVSAIKALTHLSTFVGEVFSGMAKIFQAGFSFGPVAQALRSEGIRQVTGAMSAAQAAANRIRFADEAYSDRTMNTAPQSPGVMDINISINRATLDADRIIDDLNYALRNRGLQTIGTRGAAV
jgi:hypothetical protein